MSTYILPYPPRVTPDTRHFWESLDTGVLTTTQCRDCGCRTFPPKFLCPACWSTSVDWVTLEGTGTLYSFTEVWAAPQPFIGEVPYVLGIVDLTEGLRCLARIWSPYTALTPDAPVILEVRSGRPVSLFGFRLRAGDTDD